MASRKLEVEFIGDTSSLERAFKRAGKQGGGFKSALGGIGKAAGGLSLAAGAAAIGIGKVSSQFYESQKIGKQTNAVLKSTGHAANVTSKQVNDLATAISNKTGVDDEQIQSSENLLLTFTKVRNEVGKGNDIFNQATQSVTDMSAALGQDTKSSAIQLGKALNDPIKGVTALQRVGVSFTASQKEQIKGLVEHGKTLEAQKLILKEINTEFGGSAAATATNMDRLKVTFGNLEESIGGFFVPIIEKATGFLNSFVNGMMSGSGTGGRFLAILKEVGAWLSGAFTEAVKFASAWIQKHRDDLNAVAHAARNIATAVKWAWQTVILPVIQIVLPVIQKIVTDVFKVLGGIIDVFVGLLTGDFKRAWQGLKAIVKGAFDAVRTVLEAQVEVFKTLGGKLVGGLADGVKAAGKLIVDAANWLKDKIVGAIKSVFGIHSPSTVMADLGLQLAKGLLHGFQGVDVIGFVKKQVGNIGGLVGGAAGAVGGLLKGARGKPSGNRALGKKMMLAAGFAENQWGSLDALWNGESGWNNHARNASSGAFGIPQALPASKMGAAAVAGDAAAQIAWGLSYIKSRYGTPANAYDAWRSRSPHWYAGGTGGATPGMAWVGERGPELVNFKGGETVFSHSQSMGISGYAKGTGPTAAAIRRAHALRAYQEALAAQRARRTKGATPVAADAGAGDPNQALIDSNKELQDAIDRKTAVEAQMTANQVKILALAGQGDQILAAMISAVNGGIGEKVGLGLESPGYAGNVARY